MRGKWAEIWNAQDRPGAPVSAWERLGTSGVARGRSGALGSAWESESARERSGALGCAWERLRALGSAWERLGALGSKTEAESLNPDVQAF